MCYLAFQGAIGLDRTETGPCSKDQETEQRHVSSHCLYGPSDGIIFSLLGRLEEIARKEGWKTSDVLVAPTCNDFYKLHNRDFEFIQVEGKHLFQRRKTSSVTFPQTSLRSNGRSKLRLRSE